MTSSRWHPRSSSAAIVRVAYTAPLAPVTAIAMLRRFTGSVDIDGCRGCCEIQDADVAVQIKCPLDLRQIVLAHERLLVNEQNGDADHTADVNASEPGDRPEREQAQHRDHVHTA